MTATLTTNNVSQSLIAAECYVLKDSKQEVQNGNAETD